MFGMSRYTFETLEKSNHIEWMLRNYISLIESSEFYDGEM